MRTLIQLSDVHLAASGFMGEFPTRDNLVAALRTIRELRIRPDAIVLTGDLADRAEPECYRDLLGLMEALADDLGSELLFVPGNHDDRAAFREHLLGEQPGDSPINQTCHFGGLRVIALDSVVPGDVSGLLDEISLEYLRSELSTPAPEGTVVIFHHPPIASPIEPLAAMRLQNAEE